jgi:hypothetical protein
MKRVVVILSVLVLVCAAMPTFADGHHGDRSQGWHGHHGFTSNGDSHKASPTPPATPPCGHGDKGGPSDNGGGKGGTPVTGGGKGGTTVTGGGKGGTTVTDDGKGSLALIIGGK